MDIQNTLRTVCAIINLALILFLSARLKKQLRKKLFHRVRRASRV